MRTWLYRIATNRCLDLLRAQGRRQASTMIPAEFQPPEPTRLGDILWLEPYPDALLTDPADAAPGPEARYEQRESISLAFITALQNLAAAPNASRWFCATCGGFRAREVAEMLDTTEESVTSALKRARATIQSRVYDQGAHESALLPGSRVEIEIIHAPTRAWESFEPRALMGVLDGVPS